MSISDQSIYNNYIARSLVKPDVKDFTVGTMPDEVGEEIAETVKKSIADNSGVIPKNLYGEVADKLSPYVPGMDRNALSGVLRTNGIFGLAEESASITTVGTGLPEKRKLYQDKQDEITSRTAKEFSTAPEEGLSPAAARTATSTTSDGPEPEIVGPPAPEAPIPPPVQIGDDEVTQVGQHIDEESSKNKSNYVSSVEELEYEMGSTDREISEVIVHWSETFQNANLNGQQLEVLTGAGSRKYHYIIKRDGTIERGVSISKKGDHTPGHNSYSIGVCLVGGMKVPSVGSESTTSRDDLYEKGAESLTRSQYNSLYQLFRVFFTQYPGGQALGHSEIDITADDPGFEVRDYVYNLFNKQSLYLDPVNEGEKSPIEVLEAIDGKGTEVGKKDNTLLDQKF